MSMAIMAVALFAVFRLQGQNLDLQSEAGFITEAGRMGQWRMADILARREMWEGQSSGDFGEDHPTFRYEEEITRVANSQNLFKLRLVITDDGDPLGRRFPLETLLFRQTQ